MYSFIPKTYVDVSDPVGSAYIWVRGSGSRGVKSREKQSFTNIWVFFRWKLYFEPKKLEHIVLYLCKIDVYEYNEYYSLQR